MTMRRNVHHSDGGHFAIEHHRAHGCRPWRAASLLFGLLMLGCGGEAGQVSASGSPIFAATNLLAAAARPEETHMWMTVDPHRFPITLADNEAARVFAALLPMTMEMSELNGNEKHGELPRAMPTKDAIRPGTIRNGDLMLYGADTLVVFYLTFNSSYPYTRLGRVDDTAGLAQALGRGSVRVVFSRQ